MKVKIIFTEEFLGTKAANPDVFADFIASKHPSGTPAKDELDRAEHREEAGTTVFHRENGEACSPGIYDYQVKGFFKEACGMLRNADDKLSKKVTAYKTKIDGLIFVRPRFILIKPEGKMGVCERPLIGQTAQGPRVALARSETVAVRSSIEFEVDTLTKKFGKGEDAVEVAALLEEWLNYGTLRGMGQWRNSGKGRFEWSEVNGDA